MSKTKLRFSPLLAELLDPSAGFDGPDQYKVFLMLCAAGPVSRGDTNVHNALLKAWNDRFFAELVLIKESPHNEISEDMQKCFAKALLRFTDHLPKVLDELTDGWHRSLIFSPLPAHELLVKNLGEVTAEEEPSQAVLRAMIYFAERLLVDSEHEASIDIAVAQAQERIEVYSF